MNDKQTLKLVAGRHFKTRKGEKVEYVGEANVSHEDLPLIFRFVETNKLIRCHIDGGNEHTAYSTYFDGAHDNDVVAEWVEPKRIMGFMNVYAGQDPLRRNLLNVETSAFGGQVYGSHADADRANNFGGSRLTRVACIELDILEGQGLEGGQ